MAETTTADTIAAKLTGEEAPDTTDTTEEEVESQEETVEETDTEEESTEEASEEELPDAVKDILKKNRKLLREAEAKNKAVEKELAELKANKEEAPKEETESAPVDDKFKKLFVNTSAKSALADAGLTNGTDRFLKMLDLSTVEVDDDGAITGLDEQIKELTEEFKDLIVKEEAPKKAPVKADAAGRRTTPSVPKSSADILAERLTRR